MKKIVLTSVLSMLVSVISASASEKCAKCNSNYKIFFDVNAGEQVFSYDSAFTFILESGLIPGDTSIAFKKNDVSLGLEGGVRFGKYEHIWNGGITISANKTIGRTPDVSTNIKPQIAKQLIDEIKVSTNIMAVSFDNYIRLNKSLENRLDLVAGVGVADVETNVKLLGVGVSLNSHAALLKAGMELELTEHVSMIAGADMYIPVAGQYYDYIYTIKGGLKFVF